MPRTDPEPVFEMLAKVIRQRRVARGFSLDQLATLAQLSRAMIRSIENGERSPTMEAVVRISQAFGVPCSKLIWEAELESRLTVTNGKYASRDIFRQ